MDSEVVFWKNLNGKKTVQNGFVKGKPNFSIVHDPNCYNLNVFTSHAGLFGTIEGLSKSESNSNNQFVVHVKDEYDYRFEMKT